VAARGVQRRARHRRLGVLVTPARHTLLRVATGQFGPRTTARRQLRPAALVLLGVAALLLAAPATAEGVLALLRPVGARGLQTLRGARGLLTEPATGTGRGRTALRGTALLERRRAGTLRSARAALRSGTATVPVTSGQRGPRALTGSEPATAGGTATEGTAGRTGAEGTGTLAGPGGTPGSGRTGGGLRGGGTATDGRLAGRSWMRMPCRWDRRPTTNRPMRRETETSTVGGEASRSLIAARSSGDRPIPVSWISISTRPSGSA
jgi:hypothetical protein